MDEESDRFSSLIKRCRPTSSQEDTLRTCPFSRQSEVFPGDSDDESASSEPPGIPVDPIGIVMVSPPEEFLTPTEDSLPASSEEQRQPVATSADDLSGPKFEGGIEIMDNVNLACTDAEKAVDLGKDSDNLGFFEVKSTQMVGGVNCSTGVDGAVARDVLESELEEFVVLPTESHGSVPQKLKICFKTLGDSNPTNPIACVADKDPVIMETNPVDNNDMTEVLDIEVEEIGEQMGEDNMFVYFSLRETEVDVPPRKSEEVFKNGKGVWGMKNIEDLEKFRYVSPSGGVKRKVAGLGGRRELPPSLCKSAKIAGGEEGKGTLPAKDKIFKDLLDALKMVAGQPDSGGSDEDIDFLDTAKRRGMTSPRPSWWPSEGYDH